MLCEYKIEYRFGTRREFYICFVNRDRILNVDCKERGFKSLK